MNEANTRIADLLADETNNPRPTYNRDKIARQQQRAAQRAAIAKLCATECNVVYEPQLQEFHIRPNSIYPNLEK